MNNISIITSNNEQTMYSLQFTALAQHIINKNGYIKFNNINSNIKCLDTFPSGAAAVIQTAVHKSGNFSSFSIEGATDLNDEDWTELQQGNWWISNAMINYGIPFETLYAGDILEGLPKVAADATKDLEKTWYLKYPVDSYEDLVNCKYDTYKDWTQDVLDMQGGWSNSKIVAAKFFRPTTMPTKIKYQIDDYMYVFINGILVAYYGYIGADTIITIDWTSYINLNEVNLICIVGCDTGGGLGMRFGFVD